MSSDAHLHGAAVNHGHLCDFLLLRALPFMFIKITLALTLFSSPFQTFRLHVQPHSHWWANERAIEINFARRVLTPKSRILNFSHSLLRLHSHLLSWSGVFLAEPRRMGPISLLPQSLRGYIRIYPNCSQSHSGFWRALSRTCFTHFVDILMLKLGHPPQKPGLFVFEFDMLTHSADLRISCKKMHLYIGYLGLVLQLLVASEPYQHLLWESH